MKRRSSLVLAAVAGLLSPFAATAAEQEGAADLGAAISSGEATISGRYRYEHVDQDNALDDADASTLRLRLNYRSGNYRGWSAFAEFDHVFHVLVDDFNSGAGTSPNRSDHSVVADPSGSDLNQLYVDYASGNGWSTRIGRQRILLDNQRFVGGVGWRQNEQTYDALTLKTSALERTALQYSYLHQVRRIFGQSVAAGKNSLDGHLLNAKVTLNDSMSITPYVYHLDYDDAIANSTTTFGARVAGKHAVGSGNAVWLAEFARQSDAGDNPANYDADYVRLDAAYTAENGLSVGLGYEVLGADSGAGAAFRTPLATLHAFNGWADQFLATPAAGIEDVFATVKAKAGNWNLTLVYHDFSSDTGSFDYGDEIDISASRSLGERYGLLLKGAFFSADSSSPLANVDTNKFWLQLTASY